MICRVCGTRGVTRLGICDRIVTSTTTEEIAMSLSSHLQELRKKHQSLSDAVEQAQRSPGSDDLHIATMKKQKLRLKEEISRLTEA
jgi:hypothetical protein